MEMPVTVTEIGQPAPAASAPLVKVSMFPPAIVRVPPHGVVVPSGAVRPEGSESVKATPEDRKSVVWGKRVRSRVRLTISGIDPATNGLEIVGGATTATVAVFAGPPAPDSLET